MIDMKIVEDVDLREGLIKKRKEMIKKIIIFASGKGGVGKSTISAHSAYLLSKYNKVGVLDLDLHGPSIPFILRASNLEIQESKEGIIPPTRNNIKIMSIDIFAKGRGVPLRGENKKEIIKDLFAITNFGKLDYLIIDMPPGTGDEFITILELAKGIEKVVFITIPTLTSWQVTKRAIEIGKMMDCEISGVIGNMGPDLIDMKKECEKLSLPFLGTIKYYNFIVDKPLNELLNSRYLKELKKILENSNLHLK
jgi:ATP-binding protein involved in chromosome partitioning